MTTLSRTLSTGRQIDFTVYRGVVLEHRTSESTVLSQGLELRGQGFEHGAIQTDIVRNHSFWLRKDDGREEQFDGLDLPMRQGHRITIVYAGSPTADAKLPVVALNETTSQVLALPVGGVSAGYNDQARKIFMPGVFRAEIKRFAIYGVIGIYFLHTFMYGWKIFLVIFTSLSFVLVPLGALLGVLAWAVAQVTRLSPRRREELVTYREIAKAARGVLDQVVSQSPKSAAGSAA